MPKDPMRLAGWCRFLAFVMTVGVIAGAMWLSYHVNPPPGQEGIEMMTVGTWVGVGTVLVSLLLAAATLLRGMAWLVTRAPQPGPEPEPRAELGSFV